MANYKLAASLVGHKDDVRGVVFPSPQLVLSASRDATVRVWKSPSTRPPAYEADISSHGSTFINAIAYLPPTSEYPSGLIISGGKDAIIEVRQIGSPPEVSAEALLIGHSNNVCSLDVDSTGQRIVSGSWDGQGRVWKVNKWEAEAVLEGHGGSVWAVTFWDDTTIVTGCADKLIRVFNIDGKLVRTISGNDEVIRAICRVPSNHPSGAQIASASNDGVIRLWNLTGKQIAQLRGHESFIYSLASLPTGEIISAGEDRALKIWQGNECVQSITHPAISVWCVATCSANSDIVSGASDRIVRVFTKDEERQAALESIQAFEDSVRASSIPQQQLGDINKEKLPGPEFLQQKSGTKEGQVVMIREGNGNITAHQWSTAASQWISVGTVVDTQGSSGRKQDYMGQDYDYVFDVDIQEGAPPLKLPYNISQNPYEAATKFLQENELPMTYLDQVTNFITSNTQGAILGESDQAQEVGPDPFGIESRYRPGEVTSPASRAVPPPTQNRKLPQKTYLPIKQASVKQIQRKLLQINEKLVSDGDKDMALNPTDIQTLQSLIDYLEANRAERWELSTVIPSYLELVIRIVTTWSSAHQLPGLDLLRLLTAESPGVANYRGPGDETIVEVLKRSNVFENIDLVNNIMLAVRAFTNLFETVEGRALASSKFAEIYSLTSVCIDHPNRNLGISYMTLLINYSVLFTSSTNTSGRSNDEDSHVITASAAAAAQQLLHPLQQTIKNDLITDSETIYRALVALGTLLEVGNDHVRQAVLALDDILPSLRAIRTRIDEPRMQAIIKEIEMILQSNEHKA